jgi:hypothetical protein
MKLNRSLTTSLVVLGALSLLILGAVGIPSIIGIRQLNREIGNDYLEIERKYSLRLHTRSSLATMDDLKPQLEALTRMAIIEGRELEFISALEQAAADSDVTQNLSLDTANQREISPWEREVPVGLTVVGDYAKVINYIERLQALPYYLLFNSIDMAESVERNEESTGRVRVVLRGTIRWFSEGHPIFLRLDPPEADI